MNDFNELFSYEEETGVLRWVKCPAASVKAGRVAGYDTGRGYLRVCVNGRLTQVHRIIWQMVHGEIPEGLKIDHINGIRSDNRLENLRLVSNQENNKNKRMYRNNSSGVTGITWNKKERKWVATIVINCKLKHLGYFTDFDKAVEVRRDWEKKIGFHENHGK